MNLDNATQRLIEDYKEARGKEDQDLIDKVVFVYMLHQKEIGRDVYFGEAEEELVNLWLPDTGE